MTSLFRLEEKIGRTSRVGFRATSLSGSQTSWTGEGHGDVRVTFRQDGKKRIFHLFENGQYTPQKGRAVNFQNIYRMTWQDDFIALHHERRGEENAVWLFDLIVDPDDPDRLVSRKPHPCGQDIYSATLTLTDEGFELTWNITGPRKNEHIEYMYYCRDQA